jgi:hypothetical protein
MSPVTYDELRRLRLTYESAYEVYRSCILSLALVGDAPSSELLNCKAGANDALTAARYAYGKALAQSVR